MEKDNESPSGSEAVGVKEYISLTLVDPAGVPPIDVTLWLVGQKRTIKRLDHALELIKERAAAS